MITLALPAKFNQPRSAWTTGRAARLLPDAAGVALLLGLTAGVAWDRFRDDRQLSWTDIPAFFLPWFAHLGERLRDGDIPGWNPHLFAGAPFAGDPESGWMYLPAMVFFTLLAPVVAFKAFVVFHLVLAGLATYALARVLGLGVWGSVLAGGAFEFGAFVKYTACCTAYTEVAAWIPLAFLGVELAARAQRWFPRIAGWGIAGCAISQMLAGWLGQGAYYGLLAVAAYLGCRALLSPPIAADFRARLLNLVLHSAAVFAIGFGLAAAGVLPRLDAIARSSRAGGFSERPSSDAGWFLAVGVDRLLSGDRGGRWYVGGAVVLLAMLAPLLARRRFPTAFFVAYGLVVCILLLRHTPLHDLFYLLPRFDVLHQHIPNRILIVFAIAPALLAGTTVDAISRRERSRMLLVAAPLALGAFLLATVYVSRRGEEITATTVDVVVALTIVLVIAALVTGPWIKLRASGLAVARHAVPVVIVAVVFWDTTGQWIGGRIPGASIDPDPQRTVALAADDRDAGGAGEYLRGRLAAGEPFRYLGYDPGYLFPEGGNNGYRVHYREPEAQALLVNNRALRLDLYDVQGYNPVQVRRYAELINAANVRPQEYHELDLLPSGIASPLVNLLNVRYLVVPRPVSPGRPDLLHLSQRHRTVFGNDTVRVLENTEALPRAWIVHDARRVEKGDALPLLTSGAVDPRQTALLEVDSPSLESPTDPRGDAVAFVEFEGDRIRLATRSDVASLVVLSEAYDPGWRAYVDGESVPLYVADHALRAVPIPAGDHTVELRYESRYLQIGFALSLFTGGVLAASLLAAAWHDRRNRYPATAGRVRRSSVRAGGAV